MATASSLTGDWPATLIDCANAAGVALPALVKAGETATWTVTSAAPLITADNLSTTVEENRSTRLTFLTGHEDADTAKGPEETRAAFVTVSLPRREVGDFLDLAASSVTGVKAQILGTIPAPLQNAASQVLAQTLDPTVNRIRAEIEGSVGGVLTLKGSGQVFVTFHRPKEPMPTPMPAPTAEPAAGDFCEQFNVQVAAAAAALPSSTDVFAWAGAFGAGLQTITATPPAALAEDFDIIVGFYTLAGSLSIADAGALADFIATNDIDGARVRVWEACGSPTIDPGF